MPTLLTNRRMNPALAARIERSLHGGRIASRGKRIALGTARVLLPLLLIAFALTLSMAVKQEQTQLSLDREQLLERARSHGVAHGSLEASVPGEIETWVQRLAGSYSGDLVAAELTKEGALSELLARPTVYLRGELSAVLGGTPMQEIAAESHPDALVLCLVDPPASATNADMLRMVRRAYAGGNKFHESTQQVSPLAAIYAGLPFLLPEWQAKIEAAEDARSLARLERQQASAPIPAAQRALKSELLIVVLDEPGDQKQPAEIDGDRARYIRAAVVLLAERRVLLRVRRRVDPTIFPEATRLRYARGMTGCSFALDVRKSVTPAAVVKE